MLCAACGKRITRGSKVLILSLGRKQRLGVVPKGEEVVCCSKACGSQVLTGDVFSTDVRHVPEGKLWPKFPKPTR